MPNDINEGSNMKKSTVTKEAQARRNWWYKAKRFVIRDTEMYDMGDNSNVNHITANVVVIAERLAPNAMRVGPEGGAVLVDPDQQRIPLAPDGNGPRDEVPDIGSAQLSPTPQKAEVLPIPPSNPDIIFTSEAMADYVDPDVHLDNPSTYSCTSRARAHIYSLGMLTHRAGYPIYMPTPCFELPIAYRKRGIRIGDVGTLTAEGAFDFLFNVCQSDAGNPIELPDEFKLLKPTIRSYHKFVPETCLTSDHVDHVVEGGNCDWSPEFQCSAAEGAALVLPTGATFYQAMNRIHFQNHASRHAINWYKYMLYHGRDRANGSLYLVTECTKSINWGISVFYAPPTDSTSLRFTFNEGRCRWAFRGKIEANAGPRPNDIIVTNDEEPNQCVFLRGYKIMLRPDIWGKLRSAVDVTSQDGEFSAPPSTRTTSHSTIQSSGLQMNPLHRNTSDHSNTPCPSHGMTNQLMHSEMPEFPGTTNVEESSIHWSRFGEVILEDNFFDEAPLHPSDPINLMLLHSKPDARVALVHDSEWCENLPNDFIADPVNPNVDGLLENIKQSCKTVIDDHGAVILVHSGEPTASNDSDPSIGQRTLSTAGQIRDEHSRRDYDKSDEEHRDQDESSSTEDEQGTLPQPDPDMVELTPKEHAACFSEKDGRLYHSTDAPYPLPVDAHEQQRQNLMHIMYHRLLGAHYLGPVPEALAAVPGDVNRQVLDLGAGTGKWAVDMGKAFRKSKVTGIDIVPIATKRPPINVWFEIQDFRKPLRWEDGTFDLIHARDLSMGISDWPTLITEVGRLLRSGGLFISCEWVLSPAFLSGDERDPNTHAPASMRFFRAVERALLARGVNLVGANVGHHLQASQKFHGITRRPFLVGVGDQPESEEASVIGHDLMTILQKFTNSVTPLLRDFGLTELEVGELIADYLSELQNTDLGLAYIYCITYAWKI